MSENIHPAKLGMRSVGLGIAANILLAIIKMLAGILGNSYALMADAVESTLDILSALVVWFGLKISSKPADANHPYGHGKAEPLSTIFVSLTLFLASIGIAIESVRGIRTPRQAPLPFTLLILVMVVVIKEALFRYIFRIGKSTHSTAVKSDAWHHRSDALTSVAAFIGISIALIGGDGYEAADSWAALFTAWIIAINAYNLAKPAIYELTDAAPDTELEMHVRSVAESIPGVIATHKCNVRKMGLEYYVDLDVIVDGAMTVIDSHSLAHRVQDAIREANPIFSKVLIHIEPPRSPSTD